MKQQTYHIVFENYEGKREQLSERASSKERAVKRAIAYANSMSKDIRVMSTGAVIGDGDNQVYVIEAHTL